MKPTLSPFSTLMCLLAFVAIAVCFVGCSRSENKSEKDNIPVSETNNIPGFKQTPEDEDFAKAHGAVWLTRELDPTQTTQLTVDFQDGLFSEGSTLACDLWVSDVQRENGVLMLTGIPISTFGYFEIEITTNMLSSIRTAGGVLRGVWSPVRVAFRVESFKRIESESSEDSSERYLIHGKAVAVEPIPETATKQE